MFKRNNYARELEQVTRSRRDIVAAFEIERRRIERDLHDGAQQYLVASAMAIGEAQLLLSTLDDDATALPGRLQSKLAEIAQTLERALDTNEEALTALRSTVHAIHPKMLIDMGLENAVADLIDRSPLNVRLMVPYALPQLPEGVAATAYFLISEALTNVLKYAPDAQVTVLIAADAVLRVSVVDTGPGGATIKPGGGLEGMRERLKSFGGEFECHSPAGGPTTVSGSIPLLLFQGESGIGANARAAHHSGQRAERVADRPGPHRELDSSAMMASAANPSGEERRQ